MQPWYLSCYKQNKYQYKVARNKKVWNLLMRGLAKITQILCSKYIWKLLVKTINLVWFRLLINSSNLLQVIFKELPKCQKQRINELIKACTGFVKCKYGEVNDVLKSKKINKLACLLPTKGKKKRRKEDKISLLKIIYFKILY